MSIDAIGFPLPVIVKGYACLSGAEIELAKKDIDPARPNENATAGDAPATIGTAADQRPRSTDAVPPDQDGRILSYAPGAVRTAAAEKAALYSAKA